MAVRRVLLVLVGAYLAGPEVTTSASIGSRFEFKHHDNEELRQVLDDVQSRCPHWARVYELPTKSVRGQPLVAIELTDKPGIHEPLEPEFRYVANMHGNEVTGRELLLKLADYLCERVLAGDKEIKHLLETTRIHLLPSMNPDGWDLATATGGRDYLIGRTNNNSVDLNRDFPDLDAIFFDNEREHLRRNNHLLEQLDAVDHDVQPETRAVIQMMSMQPFVLSANIHNGALVANYPFDKTRTGRPKEYTAAPDDHTFRALALAYSQRHPKMADDSFPGCDEDDKEFQKNDGITNGAKWYSVRGGMQDFAYLSTNDMELTLELGCDKYPPASALPGEWNDNKDALIHLIKMVHIGAKGVVRDARSGAPIRGALIKVRNVTSITDSDRVDLPINHDVTSGRAGDYFRLLTPGQYEVTAVAPGYLAGSQILDIQPPDSRTPAAKILDFWLNPSSPYYDEIEQEISFQPYDGQDVPAPLGGYELSAPEQEVELLAAKYRDLLQGAEPQWPNINEDD